MRRVAKKRKADFNSFLYLKVFFVVVITAIVVSLSLRMLELFRESSFTGNAFNLVIVNKNIFVLGINTNERSLYVGKLEGVKGDEIKRDREYLSFYLGIPIDAMLIARRTTSDQNIKDLLSLNKIIRIFFGTSEYTLNGLNELDLVKVFLFSNRILGNEIKVVKYSASEAKNSDILNFFKDKSIINEKISVEIINASGINGVGAKVGQLFRNIGFNVITINSSPEQKDSRAIVRTAKTYSIERLERIFTLPFEFKNETGIADVSIVIGKVYAEMHVPLEEE